MNKTFHLKTVLLGASILFLFAYVGGILIARERLADLRNELQLQAADQRALLSTIAETTARNGADEVTEKIVKDCSVDERTAFDNLLGRLDKGLSQSELITLERLFGRCGSFYSERKSVMVARLWREVEVYENLVAQLEQLKGSDIQSYNVGLWQALAEDEQKQSDAFRLLVTQQDKIIAALIASNGFVSPEVTNILDEVKDTQKVLLETRATATEKRQALISL